MCDETKVSPSGDDYFMPATPARRASADYNIMPRSVPLKLPAPGSQLPTISQMSLKPPAPIPHRPFPIFSHSERDPGSESGMTEKVHFPFPLFSLHFPRISFIMAIEKDAVTTVPAP